MAFKFSSFVIPMLLALIILVPLGCIQPGKEVLGPLRNESMSIPLNNAKEVEAQINMGVGNLTIQEGAQGSIEADFIYNSGLEKPKLNYVVNDGVGLLLVEQHDMKVASNNGIFKNDWNLFLDSHVPMSLSIISGVGFSNLRLGRLNLESLIVNGGTGNITIDLIGLNKDLNATINTGIGDLVLNLPNQTGVKVRIENGVGLIEAEKGFQSTGSVFVNEAYGISNSTLDIDVQSGISNVELNLG
jgi:hypothetical protein